MNTSAPCFGNGSTSAPFVQPQHEFDNFCTHLLRSTVSACTDAIRCCSHTTCYSTSHFKVLTSLQKKNATFFPAHVTETTTCCEPTPLAERPVLNGSDQHLKPVSVSTFIGLLSRGFDFCSFWAAGAAARIQQTLYTVLPSIVGAHIDAIHRCSHSSYYFATHV